MAHIVFSHGKESGPWGGKIRHLAGIAGSLGCTVDSLDYRECADPCQRIEKLVDFLERLYCGRKKPVVLVGSSMGACVSVAASQQYPVAGLFLLAPAFGLIPGWDASLQPHADKVEVVHGWHDELITAETVFSWCQQYNCTLHCTHDSHRLLKVLPDIGQWFRIFLPSVLSSRGALSPTINNAY